MPSQGHSRNALFWSLPTPILSSLRKSGKTQSLSERPPLPSRLHRGQIRTFQGLGSTNSVARAWCIRMTASTGRQESRVSKDWWLREGQWKARGKRDPAHRELSQKQMASFRLVFRKAPKRWKWQACLYQELTHRTCDFPQPYWRGRVFSSWLDLGPIHLLALVCDLGRNQNSSMYLGLQLARLCIDSPDSLPLKNVHCKAIRGTHAGGHWRLR